MFDSINVIPRAPDADPLNRGEAGVRFNVPGDPNTYVTGLDILQSDPPRTTVYILGSDGEKTRLGSMPHSVLSDAMAVEAPSVRAANASGPAMRLLDPGIFMGSTDMDKNTNVDNRDSPSLVDIYTDKLMMRNLANSNALLPCDKDLDMGHNIAPLNNGKGSDHNNNNHPSYWPTPVSEPVGSYSACNAAHGIPSRGADGQSPYPIDPVTLAGLRDLSLSADQTAAKCVGGLSSPTFNCLPPNTHKNVLE